MEKSAKIFVAGHCGLVGSALVRKLLADGYGNLILASRAELDLADQAGVAEFFARTRPDYVFLAAAKVGGIHANNSYPAQFIHENLVVQSNVIHAAYKNAVNRLLFLGSSCIYPKLSPQPIKEEYLLSGPLEPTNEPYAIAKIAGLKMCEAYNRQYGTRFLSVMPTNLYGPGDNFDLSSSHVLPALIRKIHEAKQRGAQQVVIWGTGKPLREFLHVDDMAAACIFVMNLPDRVVDAQLINYPLPGFVNVGTGTDISIRELAETIARVVGFTGDLVFDSAMPDGTFRKLLDVSKLQGLGWQAEICLQAGIESTYAWFLREYNG